MGIENLEEVFKKHPYLIAGGVIGGGVLVIYLLTSSSSGAASNQSNSSQSSNAAIAQSAIAANAQNAQTQAQLQAVQIQADSQNTQASLAASENNINSAAGLAATLAQISGQVQENNSNNYSAITQSANNLVAQENIAGMQESVLADQINAGVLENANNNATALGISSIQTGDTLTYGLQQLADNYGLQTQVNNNFEQNVQLLSPTFGKQYNSVVDANNAATEIQTVLSGGNPSVATSGNSTIKNTSSPTTGQLVAGATSGVATSLLAGLFG